MNTHSINLDVSKDPVSINHITIGQGDKNGTTIQAYIFDNGSPLALSGYNMYFNMLLPDGKTMYRKQSSVTYENRATFVIDETMAGAVVGTTDNAYVTIENSNTVIASTERFSVRVLKSVKDAEPAQSWSSEIDLAEAAIAAATAAANQAATDIAAQAASQQSAFENAEAERNAASSAAAQSAEDAATAAGQQAELAGSAAARANAAAGLAEEAAQALGDQASYYTYETVGDDELLTLVTIDQ